MSARSLDSEQETNNAEDSTDVLAEKHLRRLAALNHALKTLPHQARRLARIMARRKDAKPGPGAIPPIRPGIPPGLRRSKREKIDDILSECHGLMRDMELPPI